MVAFSRSGKFVNWKAMKTFREKRDLVGSERPSGASVRELEAWGEESRKCSTMGHVRDENFN